MWKKVAAFLLAAAMCGSMFVGCNNNDGGNTSTPDDGNQGGDSVATADPVTVKFWHINAEDSDPTSIHQRLVSWAKDYSANNPDNITVEMTGGKTADIVLTTLAGSSTPDVAHDYWNNIPARADSGALLDITDYINADTEWDLSDIPQAALDRCYYNGRLYSVPFSMQSTYMYYRSDLLEEIGYDHAPETIEEMLDVIDKGTIVENGMIQRMGMIPDSPWRDDVLWTVQFGGTWIDPETNTITCASDPNTVAAYQWQIDIMNKYGYQNIENFKSSLGVRGEATDWLIEGKVILNWGGESLVNTYEEFAGDIPWGVTNMPYPADRPELKGTGMVTVNVWEINKKSEHPDQAWKALSNLTSKENLIDFSGGQFNLGTFYARKSQLEYMRDEFEGSPALVDIANVLLGDTLTGFPMSAYIGEYLAAFGNEMPAAWVGDCTAQEALDKIAATIQPLADENPTIESQE